MEEIELMRRRREQERQGAEAEKSKKIWKDTFDGW